MLLWLVYGLFLGICSNIDCCLILMTYTFTECNKHMDCVTYLKICIKNRVRVIHPKPKMAMKMKMKSAMKAMKKKSMKKVKSAMKAMKRRAMKKKITGKKASVFRGTKVLFFLSTNLVDLPCRFFSSHGTVMYPFDYDDTLSLYFSFISPSQQRFEAQLKFRRTYQIIPL